MGFDLLENAMRSVLALGALITLGSLASAATAHHSRHHAIVRHSQGYFVPGWAYAAPRQRARYDGAPSYNDPSKFGGGLLCPRHPEVSNYMRVVAPISPRRMDELSCSHGPRAVCRAESTSIELQSLHLSLETVSLPSTF